MKFEKVKMLKEGEEKIDDVTPYKEVYGYRNPLKAVRLKNQFFTLSIVLFLLALISYSVDQIFSSGKNLFPYGFSIISILFVGITFFLLVVLYKDKDIQTNYPLSQVKSGQKKLGSISIFLMMLGSLVCLVLRLYIAFQVEKRKITGNTPLAQWIQVAIYLLSFFIILGIWIRLMLLNQKELMKEKKRVTETSFAYRDLIMDTAPYSWIFIVILFGVMFFVTILIP